MILSLGLNKIINVSYFVNQKINKTKIVIFYCRWYDEICIIWYSWVVLDCLKVLGRLPNSNYVSTKINHCDFHSVQKLTS